MQMHRKRQLSSPCPCIPGTTNATRNNLGIVNPASREEDQRADILPALFVQDSYSRLQVLAAPRTRHPAAQGCSAAAPAGGTGYIYSGTLQWEAVICVIASEKISFSGGKAITISFATSCLHLSELEGPVSPCICLDSVR